MSRPDIVMLGACRRWHLARLALARDKVTEDLHVTERALLPTFLNRLASMRLKVEEEGLHEFLVKQVTRVVSISGRVARRPWLERHGALHLGRLVLSVSKYLIRLPNTSAKDHQWIEGLRRGYEASLVGCA